MATFFSTPQFWATLLGAATAFLLGMVATWRTNTRVKRDAGNLALISMSQMYSIIENLRYHFLIEEPATAAKNSQRAEPYTFMLRVTMGLPDQPPSIDFKSLGFLVDSHDPDVLNRLLVVERQFRSTLDLVHRHAVLHKELQEKLSALDPTGRAPIPLGSLIEKCGVRIFIEIDDIVEELQAHLGETRDFILSVGSQLRYTLAMQFPSRRFVSFKPMHRSRLINEAPDVRPRTWRRIARASRDFLLIPIPREKKALTAMAEEPAPTRAKRFILRSFESPPDGPVELAHGEKNKNTDGR